jgi:hypothetical protein
MGMKAAWYAFRYGLELHEPLAFSPILWDAFFLVGGILVGWQACQLWAQWRFLPREIRRPESESGRTLHIVPRKSEPVEARKTKQ